MHDDQAVPLTRGALAKRAGVHAETLRFYEREGLLPPPPRGRRGYRLYPRSSLGRVLFIKQAQGLGFTLWQVRELLSCFESTESTCRHVRQRLEQKLGDLRRRMEDLRSQHEALERLAANCPGDGPIDACPLRGVVGAGVSQNLPGR